MHYDTFVSPNFSAALRNITQDVRSAIVTVHRMEQVHEIRECEHVLAREDKYKIAQHIDRLRSEFGFKTAHYEVRFGEDPEDLKLLGYIVYARPAQHDRKKLPPTIYAARVR